MLVSSAQGTVLSLLLVLVELKFHLHWRRVLEMSEMLFRVHTSSCLGEDMCTWASGIDCASLKGVVSCWRFRQSNHPCRWMLRKADHSEADEHFAGSIGPRFILIQTPIEKSKSRTDCSFLLRWLFYAYLLQIDFAETRASYSSPIEWIQRWQPIHVELCDCIDTAKITYTRHDPSYFFMEWIGDAQLDSHCLITLFRSHWHSCSSTWVFLSPCNSRHGVKIGGPLVTICSGILMVTTMLILFSVTSGKSFHDWSY